ncbi:MAG: penicillin-binding protein activator LpoB [Deltaproteobacteria bacterium]|nr:penicillin-binding protein activator LpoB [Deltaproteobacteria bacterium]
MKKIFHPILFVSLFLALATTSCGRRYAKGKYIDPNEIILRSDKFVESDLQQIADRLSESLIASDEVADSQGKLTAMISLFVNDTDEHIDMRSLSDKLKTKLFKSKKFTFVNAALRPSVKEEVEYQNTEWVDQKTATKKGKQLGAEYLISGTLSSIKQPVGRQEIVYYKMTIELTDLAKNTLAWTDDLEIKKKFRKRFTGS